MLTSHQKDEDNQEAAVMNTYFAKDLADYRHNDLIAAAEQSRRYHAARQNTGSVRRPTPRIGAVRRPFAAMHAWLVAGTL
jgi:hypothetical protein